MITVEGYTLLAMLIMLNGIFYMPSLICYERHTAFDNLCILYSIIHLMIILMGTFCRLNITYILNIN